MNKEEFDIKIIDERLLKLLRRYEHFTVMHGFFPMRVTLRGFIEWLKSQN